MRRSRSRRPGRASAGRRHTSAPQRSSLHRPSALPEPTAPPVRRCLVCERELASPAEVGWECECGVAVCPEPACFDEHFKLVAGGEGTRCRSCGLVT